MYDLNRIMVGMELNDSDEKTLDFLRTFLDRLPVEKIYFTHVHHQLKYPAELGLDQTEQKPEPFDERLEEETKDFLSKVFPEYVDYDNEICIIEGDHGRALVHHADLKNIDLLVIGQSTDPEKHRHKTTRKVVRSSTCSVLVVPAEAPDSVQTIMVPVDFSEYSKQALMLAHRLNISEDKQAILVQNVYDLHYAEPPYDLYDNRFTEPMALQTANDNYEKMLASCGIPKEACRPVFDLNVNYLGPYYTLDRAEHEDVDLIIVGAQGKGAFTGFILGSYTNGLIGLAPTVPVLVVKEMRDRELWT